MADMSASTRPRQHSVLSHGSRRSRRSSGSGKLDLIENSKDKKRLHTKADPSLAMNEAQPAAVALEESNLEDIRRMTWRDLQGNVIADPDRSNPTRSRMERPLDTIRSFEAAVEGTYKSRRSSYIGRPATHPAINGAHRRSSHFGVNASNGNSRAPYGGGFYQNGRGYGQRPDSVAEDYEGRDPRYSYPPRNMRKGSSPLSVGAINENPYPSNGQQPSYDTITTGEGSYSTDIWANSTDPSSQNSSVDRFPIKPEEQPGDNNQGIGYTYGPYSPVAPNYNNEQAFWRGSNGRQQVQYGRSEDQNGDASHHQVRGPAITLKEDRPPVPIKLNTGSNAGERSTPPKRQSWLKRRFSSKRAGSS